MSLVRPVLTVILLGEAAFAALYTFLQWANRSYMGEGVGTYIGIPAVVALLIVAPAVGYDWQRQSPRLRAISQGALLAAALANIGAFSLDAYELTRGPWSRGEIVGFGIEMGFLALVATALIWILASGSYWVAREASRPSH